MADFSLNTLFVVPVGEDIATTGAGVNATQDLTAGQVGFFNADYSTIDPGDSATGNYFYVAQGRENTYLQGTKRSDKIAGCPTGSSCKSNVTEFYKVSGCPTPVTQITDVSGWNVHCGDVVTLTLRAHSSYIDTLYFNGFTRSVTVQAPCCDCGADPCDTVDVPALIDAFIAKLTQQAPGNNPDNISFNSFYTFERVGNDANAILRIGEKPLTAYGQPCDVAAFPYEYDRMWFRTFVYSGPATTADFIVADNCNIVANALITQRSNYARGTSAEIVQLEKNYYSYQAGYLKHLYRMVGYNGNFESWVSDGTTYTTYYIKFNEYDRAAYQWGDYIHQDSQVIIAVPTGSQIETDVDDALLELLGTLVDEAGVCITTTTTTTSEPPVTTTTTSTLIP
jgi:hypothetical protein